MQIKEGIHYRRRPNQPSPAPIKAKELVDCLFCRVPSDSEDDEGRPTVIRRQWRDGIRLDKFMLHFNAKHKGDLPSEGRSLLDMGFTVAGARGDASMPMEAEESA